MMGVKPKNVGTKKLFDSPILERLTRTHIAVPTSMLVLYAVALFYWSLTNTELTWGIATLLFFSGWFVFTWVEYIAHRYVFHMATYSRLRSRIQYTIHGVHHEYPRDKDRLAMPPILSISIATMLLIVLRLVLGDYTFAFLSGFLVGYSVYLGIHYSVHAFPPPRNFLKALWINHSIHHYKDSHSVFGVSSPLWDYIYGTMSPNTKNDLPSDKII